MFCIEAAVCMSLWAPVVVAVVAEVEAAAEVDGRSESVEIVNLVYCSMYRKVPLLCNS